MVNNRMKKAELLAPAGSLEAFFAAMEKGADAVYAGLKDYSARAKAKNFSLQQMERMVAYAHHHGRRVYVTLNTLVKERELPSLVETLAALETIKVDGVILQDLAIYRLIREHFPKIPLHASTQMTIHNLLGVQQLERMGFERVVLARELHLDQIRNIVSSTSVEIECFIHGALCFSFSGQCYFSSFLGGHSGNRGRCAQPCRRMYRYRGKEGYYFSTNDFSSIDLLPQMVEAGVASLKIEGRMKSAEYVANVVEAYRLVLDARPERQKDAIAQAKELLKESFGRVPTKGFLASANPTDISTPSLRGATGRFQGEIRSIRGDRITFETRDRLHVGDRLRVQPKTDMAGKAFTIKEIYYSGKKVMAAAEKAMVSIPAPFHFKSGDAVFKVSSGTAFTMSEAACERKLLSIDAEKIPCVLSMTLEGEDLQITAEAMGEKYVAKYPLGPLDPARTTDMEGVLRSQFNRTGDTPFSLAALSAPGFPAVLIPMARLKEVRRQFYADLANITNGIAGSRRGQGEKKALAALVGKAARRSARGAETLVKVESIHDWTLLHDDTVDALIITISRANLHQLPSFLRKLKGKEGTIIWHLPFIMFDHEIPFYRDAVAFLIGQGFRCFELSNLSHFQLFKNTEVELSTDYRLFSLNSQAILAWHDMGASAVTLYMEDDAENMGELLSADLPVPRRVLLYTAIPVITSKIAIKGVKEDAPVLSDRGDAYRVEAKGALTVVTAETRFSIIHMREKLMEKGGGSFVVDLGSVPHERRRAVLEALSRASKLEGTTDFNYTMGLV